MLYLDRYNGIINRNKGLKVSDQIRSLHKFYPFWWESKRKPEIPTQKDWKKLDKKYKPSTK